MRSFIAAILFIHALACSTKLSAQKADDTEVPEKNNIIKINLSALVFKNISGQYERKIAEKFSFALNMRYMPLSKNPIQKVVEEFIDQPSAVMKQFRLGDIGITPELRFYTGESGAFNGFYLGPFFSYNNYKTDLPISYQNSTKTGLFSGNIKTYTFGLQIGAQWKMGKHGYLDWWALGPNYGSQKGDLFFTGVLSSTEQDALRTELEDLKTNMSVSVIDSYDVNKSGASIVTKGPWGGLRAMGFTIGFCF